MNKIIIALFIVVIGVLAGYYLLGNKKPVGTTFQLPGIGVQNQTIPTPTSESLYQYTEQTPVVSPTTGSAVTKGGIVEITPSLSPRSVTVNYTDTGFSPASITLKVNTSVTFVNKSTRTMWIESSKGVLSELNQGKSVGNNGTYIYTFSKVGTWKYINRMASTDTGIVIVTQ